MTVELTPELEARLIHFAEQHGQTPEQVLTNSVIRLLAEDAACDEAAGTGFEGWTDDGLRRIWQDARAKDGPYLPAHTVMGRLERKYAALAKSSDAIK